MDGLSITYGDEFAVTNDSDGNRAIRIQNGAFVEDPRWLRVEIVGGDRRRYIGELIGALEELRDTEDA